jgi:hypothetical protein
LRNLLISSVMASIFHGVDFHVLQPYDVGIDPHTLVLPFQGVTQTLDLVEDSVDSLPRHRRRREGRGALLQLPPAVVDLVVEFSLLFRRRLAVARLP